MGRITVKSNLTEKNISQNRALHINTQLYTGANLTGYDKKGNKAYGNQEI